MNSNHMELKNHDTKIHEDNNLYKMCRNVINFLSVHDTEVQEAF